MASDSISLAVVAGAPSGGDHRFRLARRFTLLGFQIVVAIQALVEAIGPPQYTRAFRAGHLGKAELGLFTMTHAVVMFPASHEW